MPPTFKTAPFFQGLIETKQWYLWHHHLFRHPSNTPDLPRRYDEIFDSRLSPLSGPRMSCPPGKGREGPLPEKPSQRRRWSVCKSDVFVGCNFEKKTLVMCQRGGNETKNKGHIQVKVLVPWLKSFASTDFECHTWEWTHKQILESFKLARLWGLRVLPMVENYKIPMDTISTLRWVVES